MAAEKGTAGPRGRTVTAVQDEIRALILHRELMPGEQLRQEEMARTLGVSRVPLREALRVLANEGLLTHRPHQGYFVTKMVPEHLHQIHLLLEFLETELVRTLRWPDEAEIAELRAINKAFAEAAEQGDIASVNRLNGELHARIFELSPQEVLRGEAERFWRLSEPYRLLHVANTDIHIAFGEHEQIIDALAARERALCMRLTAEHRNKTQRTALSMLNTAGPTARQLAAG